MSEVMSQAEPLREPTLDHTAMPHSVEAEQAVLGGLMLANESFDNVAELIGEQDFHLPENALIFATMRSLAEREQPFDFVTLSETLENNGQFEEMGGAAYLLDLAHNTLSAANI